MQHPVFVIAFNGENLEGKKVGANIPRYNSLDQAKSAVKREFRNLDIYIHKVKTDTKNAVVEDCGIVFKRKANHGAEEVPK